MASSLVSRACTSGPLAPGPNPGGGAGLALVVELEGRMVVAVVDGAVVAVVAAVSAAPVVEARWVWEPLHADSPMAVNVATTARRARLCTAGNRPPSRRGRHTVWRTPAPPHELWGRRVRRALGDLGAVGHNPAGSIEGHSGNHPAGATVGGHELSGGRVAF